MSEPMLTEYSYQAEPTTGLASVQIPLPEKVGIQANLLAGAVWK
jgi:hypothetical protein